jgi:hypothetical protein
LSATLFSQASLAFGLPKIPGVGGGASTGASQAVDVDGFMVKASETNALFQQSALLLTAFLGDKAKTAELQTKLNAIQAIADPKEKAAQLKAAFTENEAVVKATLDNTAQAAENLNQAQADQRQKIINAAYNFALGVIQAKDLVPNGQSAIASVQSNPMQATKLVGLKNTVSDLTGIVGNSTLALTTVPSLFKQAKIDAPMPTSISDKPVPFGS